ncbi:aminodeoxychorismate synthase component I [Corallococcus silvisoli]|uniref:aminodeoxychorismate synthase component I n=1 Tax=Corallococcus silvisoli TaxID=2697031 RepID=UPI001378EDC8|nr:aminodeoxychorismate synthase component I [Corallococcus silvisoli]NBD14505.1 aminodeoxychorismate synthase component I [Corallococcus silvisoli]
MRQRTLLIDNHDSFTFNLFHLLARVSGTEPLVVRNDALGWRELRGLGFDNIVISPGPGRPDRPADFGVCHDALREAEVPILGVCLGHQGLGYFHGARIQHAPEVMHGRMVRAHHTGTDLFLGIPNDVQVMRYHSLCLARPLPEDLEETAWAPDGVLMALRHRRLPRWGVQFHPESIGTMHGGRLLTNFVRLSQEHHARAPHSRPVPLSEAPRPSPAPPRAEFRVHHRKLALDIDAEQAFIALHGGKDHAFWLDSSRVEPRLSRFSFMGDATGPHSAVIRYRVNPSRLSVTRQGVTEEHSTELFAFLQSELARLRPAPSGLPFDFQGGFVGYLGYELKHDCGASAPHASPAPDAGLVLADRLLAWDHLEHAVYLVALAPEHEAAQVQAWFDTTESTLRTLPPLAPPRTEARGPFPVRLARDRATYLSDIAHCMEQLHEGETYEVCLTNKVVARTQVDALELYRVLRRLNPAPHAAYLRMGALGIACSSPERFLRVDAKGLAESKPIKGTVRRGATPEEDDRLREELRSGEKDRAENLMIVDLVRNDLGRVCDVGSVHVHRLMDVETYATVHQLVSTIRGQLREGYTAVDAVRAAFPGGSMTGAPKERTMELIDRLEGEARGVYSGAIGFFSTTGAADLNVVIRTAVVRPGEVSIGAGGAIVALSDPAAELDEMRLKSRVLLEALCTALGRPGALPDVDGAEGASLGPPPAMTD